MLYLSPMGFSQTFAIFQRHKSQILPYSKLQGQGLGYKSGQYTPLGGMAVGTVLIESLSGNG